MPEKENAPDNSQETEEKVWAKRLKTLGLDVFLLMIDGPFLILSYLVSQGLKVNNFTFFLGVLALGFGISSFLNVNIAIIPLLLIFFRNKNYLFSI